MAANSIIKAIEVGTVHQIQSGQVIVDLCSVAKELVENGIDAGATSIDVRFKNQGLDSIEIQDNGSGISPANYETLALKHYTSKLSTYADLSTLQTFGFRGEALSSLCALSKFSVVTATQGEAPKARKLEFDTSGKLVSTSIVSGQKGTTVVVENLFHNLPVRRRELERNIKREWGKVVNLLNQYACVQTGVKFSVSQQPTKGKRMVLFSTKGNPTTRENIINVFGVKTMNALVMMDLQLSLIPTTGPSSKRSSKDNGEANEIFVRGHVSRPNHGEGRQAPDRQMFYVNGRPCGLPQFAKVFNEVYRSYNSSQSPFIFADIQLDTHLYDVNVSPDKRTILLHDQGQMLDNLREKLVELFEKQDVTVPVAQLSTNKQTPFKKLTLSRSETSMSVTSRSEGGSEKQNSPSESDGDTGPVMSEDEEEVGEHEVDEMLRKRRVQSGRKKKKSTSTTSISRESQGLNLISRWVERRTDAQEAPQRTTLVVDDHNAGTAKKLASSKMQVEPNKELASIIEDQEDEEQDDAQNVRMETSEAEKTVLVAQSTRTPEDGHASPPEDGGDMTTNAAENSPRRNSGDNLPPPINHSPAVSTNGSSKRRGEQFVIKIGDHTITSPIGTPSKMQPTSSPTKITQRATRPKESKTSTPLPSFGGRLSQLFSASGTFPQVTATNDDLEAERGEDVLEETQHSDAENAELESLNEDEAATSQRERSSNIDERDDLAINAVESATRSRSSGDDSPAPSDQSDGDFEDEDEVSVQQEEDNQEAMIVDAEALAKLPEEVQKRTQMLLKGGARRMDSTLRLVQRFKIDTERIKMQVDAWNDQMSIFSSNISGDDETGNIDAEDAEEKLSLKISKSDFGRMRVVGQFNLGFVLAVREAEDNPQPGDGNEDDQPQRDADLFIIDQHASDEKYNFERLQSTTVVQSQRLVQPKTLELTALEEEVIMDNIAALESNGFKVQVDDTGATPVGSRVQLLSLPLSRETTFSLADLEELVFLLADNPTSSASTVPRPARVRKMFAMRACRSSIMIGKALSRAQMERVVRHMGEMEKPWNCPHGRPTMRHLCGLGSAWNDKIWTGDGGVGNDLDWAGWVKTKRES